MEERTELGPEALEQAEPSARKEAEPEAVEPEAAAGAVAEPGGGPEQTEGGGDETYESQAVEPEDEPGQTEPEAVEPAEPEAEERDMEQAEPGDGPGQPQPEAVEQAEAEAEEPEAGEQAEPEAVERDMEQAEPGDGPEGTEDTEPPLGTAAGAEAETESAPEADQERRKALWVGTAIVAVALAGLLVVLAIVLGGGSRPEEENPAAGGSGGSRDPALEQAPWKIKTRSFGTNVPKAQRQRAAVQGERVADVLKKLYEAFYLAPGELGKTAASTMSRAAARSFTRSRLPLPSGLDRVQTSKRTASITIEPRAAAQAAAVVEIAAKGLIKQKRVRFGHQATLWLERNGKTWRVIAFEASRSRGK